MASIISAEIMRQHRARWFVYAGGQRMRHAATMRGHWPGWDVECACGWRTSTGGATRRYVEDELLAHRWSAQCASEES